MFLAQSGFPPSSLQDHLSSLSWVKLNIPCWIIKGINFNLGQAYQPETLINKKLLFDQNFITGNEELRQ